jgi:tetratricopeptide (TPR) repeat protein
MDSDELKHEKELVTEGDLLDSKGQYEKAIADYDKALQIDPDNADVWFDKGETLKKMGKLAEAEKCFEMATKLYDVE